MHVHVGSSATESGCVGPSFASAGGHFNTTGETHGNHVGDMPSILLVEVDGKRTGKLTFETDRFAAADLEGKAVILHAGRDNFNNVPSGSSTSPNIEPAPCDQGSTPGSAGYIACAQAALTNTANTGDAGARRLRRHRDRLRTRFRSLGSAGIAPNRGQAWRIVLPARRVDIPGLAPLTLLVVYRPHRRHRVGCRLGRRWRAMGPEEQRLLGTGCARRRVIDDLRRNVCDPFRARRLARCTHVVPTRPLNRLAMRHALYRWLVAGLVATGATAHATTVTFDVDHGVPSAVCGDGMVQAGEDCDDGGACVGGDDAGSHCTAESQCRGNGVCTDGVRIGMSCRVDVDCPGSGCVHCRTFGGDGCAANCTAETDIAFDLIPGVVQGDDLMPGTSGAMLHGDILTIPVSAHRTRDPHRRQGTQRADSAGRQSGLGPISTRPSRHPRVGVSLPARRGRPHVWRHVPR